MQSKHIPDGGPTLLQRGDKGVLPGWAAASGPPLSGASLSLMLFRDVEDTVCYFQLLGVIFPDSFLETLHSLSVVSEKKNNNNFIVVGDFFSRCAIFCSSFASSFGFSC